MVLEGARGGIWGLRVQEHCKVCEVIFKPESTQICVGILPLRYDTPPIAYMGRRGPCTPRFASIGEGSFFPL